MTPLEVGLLGTALLLLLLVISMPVGFAMGVVGFIGFALIVSPDAALSMVTVDLYETFNSYGLTVIPLFIFMGQIALHSGISRKLFDSAYYWLGPLPGGMAMATIGACTGFGAICGSGPATAATMASVALPEMKRFKYDMSLATGAVAAGGGLGMLIPPSVVFICYAIMTEQSIGKLFLAGVVPGILIAFLFCVLIYLKCRANPSLGPVAPPSTFKRKFLSLLGISETLILFILVIGGMFAGFFTPTEAAAVGAGGSLLLAVLERKISFKALYQALKETARTSCMVMIIVAGATMFGHFLAVTRIPFELANWLSSLTLPSWIIMGFIILFFLLAGCFVDALALIMLTIPIIYPVVTGLGYNPIWFGVIVVIVTQMGVISPPVGVNAYVVSGIERDVPLQVIFRGTIPFLLTLVLAAVILMLFPALSLWLPNLGG